MSSAEHEKQSEPGGPGAKPDGQHVPPQDAKPGLFKKLWAKTGLDSVTIILMLKGALPPIIALAGYQADDWAEQYTTLGYLVAIMAMLSMAIQPRAKFIQAMTFSLLFVCLGSAVALLEIQSAVSARNLQFPNPQSTITGSSGSKQSVAYSSSASAVAAVWLFFTIYVANVMKAYRPQLMVPIIQYAIFTIVASTYAPNFPNMQAGMNFVRRLLITFLTGFGVGTGVSFLVVPMTSRTIAGKQMGGLLDLMKKAFMAHDEYMQSVTTARQLQNKDEILAKASVLRANVQALASLFAKVGLEITFAKKEIAIGKLRPHDYSTIYSLAQEMLQPIVGFSTFLDVIRTVMNKKKTERDQVIDSEETLEAIRSLEAEEWDELVAISLKPYSRLKAALADGLTHASYVLELTPQPKSAKGDVEKSAVTQPGDAKFAVYLEEEIDAFHQHRTNTIQKWAERKGIHLPLSFWEDPQAQYSWKDQTEFTETVRQIHNQQQLYLILYMEYLMYSIATATLNTVRYADSKVADGTMMKKRFIFPGWRRIRKLVEEVLTEKDTNQEMRDGNDVSTTIHVGDSFRARKDPEHLPPTTFYQKSTNILRQIPKFLASSESAFAFRAAIATISLGILGYIAQTGRFYLQNRGMWALIMVAISMDINAGRGIFGFMARIAGTVVAMIASLLIWYIGDKHPAAILPVFYIYLCLCLWFFLKNPTLAISAVISMVTCILIIGYELQDEKIGRKLTTSNGQTYYPIYELAPYRLGAVCAGIGVAFIWTYFPYPVTTHGTLRRDLGHTLYLMANYYSCTHTTVRTRLLPDPPPSSTETQKGHPMHQLAKARSKVFSKTIIMLSKLEEHSQFTKWEPTFGGKFPRQIYDDLIGHLRHILKCTALIVYSSKAFTKPEPHHTDGVDDSPDEEDVWLSDFRAFTRSLPLTTHAHTSTLCLLAASMTNGQPLPPYLRLPKAHSSSNVARANSMRSNQPELDGKTPRSPSAIKTLRRTDTMLSPKHVHEPCYAAFAVLEVASSLITEELREVVEKVKELVGEVDFDFQIVSTRDADDSEASTLAGDKGKQD